jgi:hypothetical protein
MKQGERITEKSGVDRSTVEKSVCDKSQTQPTLTEAGIDRNDSPKFRILAAHRWQDEVFEDLFRDKAKD